MPSEITGNLLLIYDEDTYSSSIFLKRLLQYIYPLNTLFYYRLLLFTSMTSFLACLYIKRILVHIKIKCLKDKYIGIIC